MSLQLKSKEILDFFQGLRNDYQDPNYVQQKERQTEEGIRKELQFLEQYQPACSLEEIRRVRRSAYNVNYNKVKAMLREHFDDGQVLHFIACLTLSNALLITPENEVRTADGIHKYLTDLKRIGEPSGFGIVLRGRLDNNQGFYIMKVSQRQDEIGNAAMRHEIVAGTHLNELRDLGIPNFVYTYGSFRCSPPIFDDKGNVMDWCNEQSDTKAYYVLYEDIEDAITCYKYLSKDSSPTAFYSVLMQVAMASRMANDRYGYTHYDLHMGNLLMRSAKSLGFSGDFYIPYKSRSGTEYFVLANRVASIIDYGSVYVNGYGSPEPYQEFFGKYNDRSLPLRDIYFLICFMVRAFLDKSGVPITTKRLLVYCLQFFINVSTEAQIATFLVEQEKVGYGLPYNDPQGKKFIPDGVDMETFIDYLFRVPTNILSPQLRAQAVTLQPVPGRPILRCRQCYSFQQVFLKTTDNGDTGEFPSTFEQVYEDAQIRSDYEVPTSFSPDEAYKLTKEELNTLQQTASTIIRNLNVVDLTSTNIYDPNTLEGFRRFYYAVVELYQLLNESVQKQKVLNWLKNNIPEAQDWKLDPLLKKATDIREQLTGSIKGALSSLVVSRSSLEQALSAPTYANLTAQNPIYKWYDTIYFSLKELTDRKKLYDGDEDVEMQESSNDKGKEKEKQFTRRQSFVSSPTGEIVRRTKLLRK